MSDLLDDREAIDIDSIEWENATYTLRELLQSFELPQIVCVKDGYFDVKEITSLSTNEVLTLHYAKKCKMLKGVRVKKQDKEVFIPLTSQCTLELFKKDPKMYNGVQALKTNPPKKVLSVDRHECLGIQENDILKIKGFKKKLGQEMLCCTLVKSGEKVQIPTTYEAIFQAYEEPVKRIKISDAELYCSFPCYVQLNGYSRTPNIEEPLDVSTLGRIKLLGVYNFETVIASTRHSNKVTVLQFPVNLDITVTTAKGAKQKHSQYEYLRKEVHEYTQLQRLNEVDLDYAKIGDGHSVENIYDYIDPSLLRKTAKSSKANKPPLLPKPRRQTLSTDEEMSQVNAEVSRTSAEKSRQSHANAEMSRTSPEIAETSRTSTDAEKSRQLPEPEMPSISNSPAQNQIAMKTTFTIPESLENLSIEGVANCLRYLHMEQYVEKFKQELVDGAMFVQLDTLMMEESLGVTNKFHQKKLKMLVEGWRPK